MTPDVSFERSSGDYVREKEGEGGREGDRGKEGREERRQKRSRKEGGCEVRGVRQEGESKGGEGRGRQEGVRDGVKGGMTRERKMD